MSTDYSQQVADILDGLGDTPTPDEVYHAVKNYSVDNVVAATAATAKAGGGGGGSQPITHEAFASGPSNGINDGESEPLGWVRDTGDVLVDLTDPLFPVIVTEGVYAVTVGVTTTNLTAGGYFSTELVFDYDGAYQAVSPTSPTATAVLTNPTVVVSLTYYLPAGAKLALNAYNFDGVATRNFQIVQAYIQRLA
jgi:hypothetical protein